MNITAEMCMMRNLWHDLEEGLLCTPKELYDDIVKAGYDWDLLLDSRGFWLPLEEKGTYADLPFLSTMDLLNMRAGTYRPYWYDAAVKAKGIATKAVEAAAGKPSEQPDLPKPVTGADLLKKIAARQEAKVS
ncbi:hypothetical protein D3C77_565660 [compost metagenome]